MTTKKELLEQIKNTKWYRQALHSKAYYIFNPWFGGMRGLCKKLNFIILKDNIYLEGIYNEEELISKAKQIIRYQKKDIHYIDRWLSKCRIQMKKFENLYIKYKNFNFEDANFKQVIKVLNEFDKVNYNYWANVYICDFFDPNGEELLQQEIKKAKIKFRKNELAHLLRPQKNTYIQVQRLELLKAAFDIKNKKYTIDDPKVIKVLQQQANKYYYIDNSWESTRVLKIEDFRIKLLEILNDNTVKEIKEQVSDIAKDWISEHKKIMSRHKIPRELKNIIYFYRQLVYLRDERKEHVMLCNHFFDLGFLRISKLLNIKFEDLNATLISDFNSKFSINKFRNQLNKRKNFFVASFLKKKISIFNGKEGEAIFKAIHNTFEHKGKTLKGNSACKGRVKGVVCVVMGESHFSKFNKGEILVAPMTRPEYLPLMKAAKAIITDEGGITSHAAIVSRELGKPCIIGTKVATKVLSSGEKIEVDADKGIIKKL